MKKMGPKRFLIAIAILAISVPMVAMAVERSVETSTSTESTSTVSQEEISSVESTFTPKILQKDESNWFEEQKERKENADPNSVWVENPYAFYEHHITGEKISVKGQMVLRSELEELEKQMRYDEMVEKDARFMSLSRAEKIEFIQYWVKYYGGSDNLARKAIPIADSETHMGQTGVGRSHKKCIFGNKIDHNGVFHSDFPALPNYRAACKALVIHGGNYSVWAGM